MSTGRKRIIAGVLALAAVLVVGCGSSSDDTSSSDTASTPEDAVQTFYDTSKAKDGAGACAVLSSDSQDIAAAGADSCEAAFDAAVKASQANVADKLEIGDVESTATRPRSRSPRTARSRPSRSSTRTAPGRSI